MFSIHPLSLYMYLKEEGGGANAKGIRAYLVYFCLSHK